MARGGLDALEPCLCLRDAGRLVRYLDDDGLGSRMGGDPIDLQRGDSLDREAPVLELPRQFVLHGRRRTNQHQRLARLGCRTVGGVRVDVAEGFGERHVDAEAGALADARAQHQRMAQQVGRAPHDGQAEPQSLVGVSLRIVELDQFIENGLLVLGRDSRSGIPDFDTRVVGAAPARDEDAASCGVAHRIADQVEQDAVEQGGVGQQPAVREAAAQRQALRGGAFGEAVDDPADGLRGMHRPGFHADDLAVEPRVVEQRREETLQVGHGVAETPQLRMQRGVRGIALEARDEQAERLDRLAQVVAGRGEEAAARLGGLRGLVALLAQCGRRRVDARRQLFLGLSDRIGHAIDAVRELAEFVVAGRFGAQAQAPLADALDDMADVGQCADQAARERQCQQRAEEQHHHRDRRSLDGVAADFVVQRLHRHLQQQMAERLPCPVGWRRVEVVADGDGLNGDAVPMLDAGSRVGLRETIEDLFAPRDLLRRQGADEHLALGVEKGGCDDIRLAEGGLQQALQRFLVAGK